MQRILIHILLIVALLSDASAGQLLKLPILVSHYLEHQQRDKAIGFIDFLSMHYWGNDINDNDHDRDMQLPFKSSLHHCCNQLPSLPVTSFPVIKQFQFSEKNEFIVTEESDLIDPALTSLFRPPRA